ncbi:hypothetical protein Forpe1208_v017079 [Fusarium oxysporum f. sp. rapae]|uniref:Zn(2)-C6 fungal-type domain-containing protein n=1 Tax=Fusarium oxysporum f. sp. rapae TaxID=485398 RepID=A0A8J5NHU1_FUSOX|nr:hypothetical protein Forpe1208_v017160 [Fusarium oxysporum f. sp. rapae]KAG7402555.1 hypothetical protein Forpe1208_v017079 [Fusarium oxysporum f. sp. rapae]
MATSDTLPSIQEALGGGYPADPRYASPNAVNGYPPPGQPQQYVPPLQPQSDPRSSAYPPPPPDQRSGYYDDRRPPYGQEPYGTDPYYAYYRVQPLPPGPPPPNGHPGYCHVPAGVYEYPPVGNGGAPPLTQAPRRTRASIACTHCRKKKIRCSGYQSAVGGKCQNCTRTNQECIFQPVSSSSSTAFVLVSALPGGVSPGIQLFGAYGQPLAPGTIPASPPTRFAHQSAPSPSADYYAPVQSPAESLSSYGDARTGDGSQLAGRRRRRTSEEQDEGYRLPPPRSAVDKDPRRRPPAEFSNHSSPGGVGYPPYQGARQVPRNSTSCSLPQATTTGSYAASAPGSRSPTGENGSNGAFTSTRQGQQPTGDIYRS